MPVPLWLPFALMDRMELAPPRVSATTEVGASDDYRSVSETLHAQLSTECDCHIGAYGTLPLAFSLAPEPPGVAAAGGPVHTDESRATIGTADVGVFGGNDEGQRQTIYRLGFLLPSASREQSPLLASGRVGDMVLEMPRTAGVRISESRIFPVHDHPTRFDVGLDVANQYANEDHARIVHVIPRAGLGTQLSCDHGTLSVESALAWDPFVYRDPGLRWSAGVTGHLARADHWFIKPAVTIAAVRTPDGWSGAIALDLAASRAAPEVDPL